MGTPNMNWIPEIVYEEADDGLTSNIPFIAVPENEEMPKILFIFESRHTGEYEPGLEGEELPVSELDLYQYASMNALRDSLPQALYNQVRVCLGLEPLSSAVPKGQKISENIRKKLEAD